MTPTSRCLAATPRVFPGAGHFPQLDDPLRFVRVMLDFVETTPPAQVDAARWGELLRSRSPESRRPARKHARGSLTPPQTLSVGRAVNTNRWR